MREKQLTWHEVARLATSVALDLGRAGRGEAFDREALGRLAEWLDEPRLRGSKNIIMMATLHAWQLDTSLSATPDIVGEMIGVSGLLRGLAPKDVEALKRFSIELGQQAEALAQREPHRHVCFRS